MKIKGKQDIEYWVTTGKNGGMIRVYRIDPLDEEPTVNPFQVPILIEYMGMGESIANILEDREKLRKEKEDYKYQLEKEIHEKLEKYLSQEKVTKKWWEFWKQ